MNAEKGTFYDHATSDGGGILFLIQKVLGCTSQNALYWLALRLGLTLDGNPAPTPEQKRDFAADKQDAQQANWWRWGLIVALSAVKAEAYNQGDMDMLIDSSRHLYSMQRIKPDSKALLDSYRANITKDRKNVERYVRYGREDEEYSAALTKCAVGVMAEGA